MTFLPAGHVAVSVVVELPGTETVLDMLTISKPLIPGRPCGPIGPMNPCGPIGPCGPVAPVAPVSPLGPAAPVSPFGPTAPVAPAGPASPCGPAAPVGPTGPTGPTSPCGPTGPATPASPFGPAAPVSPFCPAAPVSPFGPAGPAGPAEPCPGVPTFMLKNPRSFSDGPRMTESRCVPSGTAAGRNTTSSVSVALITDIRLVSHQTCGAGDPNERPRIVSVWLTRSTVVLSTTTCSCDFDTTSVFFWACASAVPKNTNTSAVNAVRFDRRIKPPGMPGN